MKNYIPNRPPVQEVLVVQSKYVTSSGKFTRSGRAVKRDVPTDFETTYRQFLTLNP